MTGMTGLWQINGRSDADDDQRVYLDAGYVKNGSFGYDLIILLKTSKVAFNREGAYGAPEVVDNQPGTLLT
jgi:lipopolysaccharide/colanic/teichoic acid biosynthesis glycosyltransferase